MVYFIQADPFDHAPDFISLFNDIQENLDSLKCMSCGWKKWADPYHFPQYCDGREWVMDPFSLQPIHTKHDFVVNNAFKRAADFSNFSSIKEMLETYLTRFQIDGMDEYRFCYGAIMAVPTRNILSRSKKYWKRLYRWMLETPDNGLILERLWLPIMRKTIH